MNKQEFDEITKEALPRATLKIATIYKSSNEIICLKYEVTKVTVDKKGCILIHTELR